MFLNLSCYLLKYEICECFNVVDIIKFIVLKCCFLMCDYCYFGYDFK